MTITTVNPANEETLHTYPVLNESKVMALIDAGHLSYLVWRKTDFTMRSRHMHKAAQLLRNNQERYARLMAKEMGKPVTQGKAEIEKCAWTCEYFAEQAPSYLASRKIETEMNNTEIFYQPLGIIFAIMPWNFPFWQVFRCAAPNLMAGNGVMLKHAPVSIGVGNAIAELFLEAGFPEHLFQHVILDNEIAGKVIANAKIRGVTLTGSTRAGSIIGAHAGHHLKKVILELGGNDPYLVLEDANLKKAARAIVLSRMNNSGQVCIAAKRVIVVKEVAQALTNYILLEMKQYITGDPLNPLTTLGPLARRDIREHLHQQVTDSQEKGATILLGGVVPQEKGFYYPPTVLVDVYPGMPAFDEELFGPVISITEAEDECQGIRLANQSIYGLGAAVFTGDMARGERIAREDIEAGSCFVNEFVTSDPRVPFGGIKNSGFGRELSREGILEFVNIKTISLR